MVVTAESAEHQHEIVAVETAGLLAVGADTAGGTPALPTG